MVDIKLSVIIVAYNGYSVIADCLDSIRKYNDIGNELEVIVSDNSPNMYLFEKVGNEYEWVTIIHNSCNGGFGYGNNRGAEIAKGEYFLFLNPDTVLIEPIFGFAIDVFEKNQEISHFGVKLVSKSGEYNHPHALMDSFGVIHVLKQNYYWKHDVFVDNKMFITGADMFIRSETFIKAGRFDENIFMYYEESDLIRRIKKCERNSVISYFSEKSIIHLEGGTTDEDKNKLVNAEIHALKSLKYYCKKHDLNYQSILCKLVVLQLFRIMKYFIKNKKDRVKLEYDKLIVYIQEQKNSL